MKKNNFVNYLDQFNILSPNHSKIYDEYTVDNEFSKYSFTIDTKVQEQLLSFYHNNPRSVILTGNAGDGKTRLCRVIHDDLRNEKLGDWPEKGIIDIDFQFGTLRIVKDLSELRDDVIFQQLKELQETLSDNSRKLYFLIAANEGKLTKFLSNYDELKKLREEVGLRFKDHRRNDEKFSVINLLDITSSVYVKAILDHWNCEENWEVCLECGKKESCIIYLNHIRTSRDETKNRILEQYRILDYLDIHVTMRELLIHLGFTLTGGLVCDNIHEAQYKELSEQSNKVYYENFYGYNVNSNAFAEMKAIKAFRIIDPGISSQSEIDDFIINGDISGDEKCEQYHKNLFNKELDMSYGYFSRKLKRYRDHNGVADSDFIDQWVSKLRRKFYFEVPDEIEMDRMLLLPFQHLTQYEDLFSNDKMKSLIRTKLINGLNRSFTNRLVKQTKNVLFATSQDLMIYDEFKGKQVEIKDQSFREDIDFKPSKFTLEVNQEVSLPMNLYIFEYLMRVNSGGTYNLLSEETHILIDTFKNELLKISEPEEYVLNVLRFDKDSGLYVEDQINL
ncbi:hypothetical protein CACET_c21400 [Clostridium aceticum]|uniref:Uncharacterized protein n=1 Tax=Clostridium aceticum TaxID=84022 RepID=A0A0D8I9X8_9CLOT|nr:hypothetical protein [Clostridium aceticum]AKL95587.1 hypothetical protein CACET_c21400 [Clostridium aceticum]KJF26839.1 hypothetical protein TZ02_11550 [Clostridium aceticum]